MNREEELEKVLKEVIQAHDNYNRADTNANWKQTQELHSALDTAKEVVERGK